MPNILFLVFTADPLDDEQLLGTLKKYIKTGEQIRRQPNFASSNIGILDEMVKDIPGYFKENNAGTFFRSDSDFSNSFIALTAPSLDGKTQSAFALRKAKVLYFVIFDFSITSPGSIKMQLIYECFKEKSKFLCSAALKDYVEIFKSEAIVDLASRVPPQEQDSGTSNESSKKDITISTGWLTEFPNIPLRVLGYWLELMKAAKNVQAENWIEVYAKLEHLDCKAVTLNEFKRQAKDLGPFCIFLDEFSAAPWSVYIRNLARAAGIPCVVSNTNSRIANLIGVSINSSRTEGPKFIWSIVFDHLNQTAPELIDSALT